MTFVVAPESMPATISVHVFPPSRVRYRCGRMSSRRSVLIAAYAVSVSKCDASMIEILLHGRDLSAGGVTSFHVLPPSNVTWIRPSSLPAQMTFSFTYDGASVYTTPG